MKLTSLPLYLVMSPLSRLQQSVKQNDQVYHELVPSTDSLEPAQGQSHQLCCLLLCLCASAIGVELVKPVVFQPVDKKMFGSDIFARLVPMKAYEASSIYRLAICV